jgi:ornithine cyclodeaminase
MGEVRIVTEAELRAVVQLDRDAVATVAGAFRALAGGKVVMPPILSMEIEDRHGEIDVKTAYLPGLDHFAVKISPGFFDNPKLGLASVNGLMVVFSARTGLVEAVLLDQGYLTDVRTAAAGALAADHLAPADVRTVGVLGAGVQARLQLQALHLVRPYTRALVWARDRAKAEACAADIAAATGADAEAIADPARLVAASRVVVTTTPATAPVLKAEWLHPGLHVTAMGSDQETKNELEPGALARADLYVCDRVDQCARLGELRAARAAGVMADRDPVELGAVVAGTAQGRTRDDAITICDLTGTGAQDTAIAALALARLDAAGAGRVVAT